MGDDLDHHLFAVIFKILIENLFVFYIRVISLS